MCKHENVILDVSGGRRMSGGEVDDNITEQLLCLDCHEFISDTEYNGALTEIPFFNFDRYGIASL